MEELVNRFLISDQKILENVIPHFEFLKTDNNNWTKLYFEKSSNQEWLLFYVNPEFHGGGMKILARYPIPGIDELIDIAISSEYDDEVTAICKVLIDSEKMQGLDFRAKLIDKLEKINHKSRQSLIIEETQLTSMLNRKDILGKSPEQINSDSNHFQNIANRANQLL